jgi:hypothetical protein
VEEPVDEPASPDIGVCADESCVIVASKHVQNDGSVDAIDSVDLSLKKSSSKSSGIITVAIAQGEDVLATGTISTYELQTSHTTVTAELGTAAGVQGRDFDVIVMYEGSGTITVASIM